MRAQWGIGFSLILILIVAMGLNQTHKLKYIGSQVNNLYTHPFAVSNAVLGVQARTLAIHRSMKDAVLSNDNIEFEKAASSVTESERIILKDIRLIQERYLGEKEQVERLRSLILAWRPIRQNVIQLIHMGNSTDAAAVTKGEGAAHVDRINQEIERLNDFAQNKAQEFMDNAEQTRQSIITSTYFTVAGVIACYFLILAFLAQSYRREQAARQEREESIAKSEKRYRSLIESMSDGLCVVDENHTIKEINNRLCEMLGYSKEGLLNEEIATFIDSSQIDVWDRRLEGIRCGKSDPFDIALRGKHQETLHALVSPKTVRGAGDSYAGFFALFTDITKRKQAEDTALHLGRILEDTQSEIYIFDAESLQFVYANHCARHNSGYTMDEMRELTPLDLKPNINRESFLKIVRPLRTGEKVNVSFVTEHMRRDGTLYPADVHLQLMAYESRPVFVAVILDLTERRQLEEKQQELEEQLRQSQKMESVGRLAGGVAHDFNNLLMAILGYSDLMEREVEEGNGLYESVKEIQNAANRAATLIRQLLAFSRKQVLMPRVLDMNELLNDMQKMLQRMIGEDIKLVALPGQSIGMVKADPGQIEQIIMNLAVNARDAMPKGGQLTIETGNVELDESYIQKHTDATPGPHVMLAVSDTGEGMDAETLAQIFEPFFTTKETGRGTGLGLATVYGIVKQSGGNIWVYSEQGTGTTFKIYLPRTDAQAEADGERAANIESEWLKGNETVLLVEDEDMVRRLVSAVLLEFGYTVLEASNGRDAIELAEEHDKPIHLLLTDVVMPNMSGKDLADELTRNQPSLKVLFMSGYTDNAVVHHGALNEGLNFIQKPIMPKLLAEKVRSVLTGGRVPHIGS